MLRTRFFQAPLTFRHVLDGAGCVTLSDLILKACDRAAPFPRAMSLLCRDRTQDHVFCSHGLTNHVVGAEIPGDSLEYARKSASSGIDYFEISDAASFGDLKFPFVYCFDALADAESLDDTIQTAWAALDPGGIFAYIGYAGPKNGLGTKDLDAITSLLSAIPENLLNDPRGVNESQIHSFMEEIKPRHAGGAIEAAVEARFGSQEITPLGSLFSYFLWRATLGNLSYDRDANVALILMAQAIEQRLILSRLIRPTIKLIVARKEVDI